MYDAKAQKIGAINQNLHLLIDIVLSDLPDDAKILCVGVGTGGEILSLAAAHPGWHFTGVDPSESMLAICRQKIETAGLHDRCTLTHGYVSDIPATADYDAVLCLLVTHFIKDDAERGAMFADMHARLKPGGYLINAEISYDVNSARYGEMMDKWKAMHIRSGASEEQAAHIPQTLANFVNVASPTSMEEMLKQNGFAMPVLFFQSFLIHAWYSRKKEIMVY